MVVEDEAGDFSESSANTDDYELSCNPDSHQAAAQVGIGMIELADKNGRSRKRRRFMAQLPVRAKKMAILVSILILAGAVVFIRKRQLLRRVLSALYRLFNKLFNSFSKLR